MRYKRITGILVKTIFIVIVPGIFLNKTFGETISVFYNLATSQHDFAANDIKTALEQRFSNLRIDIVIKL
jgi:hypothetical protein